MSHKPKAFITYRRQDTSAASRWLAESLQAAFGESSVFIDVEAIRIGERWSNRIVQALHDAAVLIAVIGPSWLTLTDKYSRRRIDAPNDWVRHEIVHAIENRLEIIPLMVSGTTLPPAEALPECLAPMLSYHALELRDEFWEADRSRLIQRLEQLGFARDHATPLPDSNELARRQSTVFERQLETLKTAVALAYRARNSVRMLRDALGRDATQGLDHVFQDFHSYNRSFAELLFEERALLPGTIFPKLHELKNTFQNISNAVVMYQDEASRPTQCVDELAQRVRSECTDLESRYENIVESIQVHIGVQKGGLHQQ